MDKKVLQDIIGAPGIAGDEDLGILEAFKKLMPAGLEAEIWPQRFATVELTDYTTPSLLVIAHADTNGLRVTKITDDGYLRFQVVGGVSSAHYLSSIVEVWSTAGKKKKIATIQGVVGWKAFHHLEGDEKNKAPNPNNLVIDIGARDKAQAEELGIRIGDPITFGSQITYLKNNLIAANGLDDRAGVWCVIKALHEVYKCKPAVRATFAVSGKEEIGLVGAQQIAGLHNHFDFCIGIDVGFANDYPGAANLKSEGPEIALGKGPIIYRGSSWDRELVENALSLAQDNRMPYQLDFTIGGLGTDAAVFDRKGTRTIHFGIPCRYPHFKEVISLNDLQSTVDLVVKLIKKL